MNVVSNFPDSFFCLMDIYALTNKACAGLLHLRYWRCPHQTIPRVYDDREHAGDKTIDGSTLLSAAKAYAKIDTQLFRVQLCVVSQLWFHYLWDRTQRKCVRRVGTNILLTRWEESLLDRQPLDRNDETEPYMLSCIITVTGSRNSRSKLMVWIGTRTNRKGNWKALNVSDKSNWCTDRFCTQSLRIRQVVLQIPLEFIAKVSVACKMLRATRNFWKQHGR